MSESEIKRQICEAIALARPRCLFWQQESAGVRGRKKNSRFQRNGVADIPAILFVLGIPISCWLEVKTAEGRQSAEQLAFEKELEKRGGFYAVVRSPEEALAALARFEQAAFRRIRACAGSESLKKSP